MRKITYTPVNPSFTRKVGFKGIKIIQACFRKALCLSHFQDTLYLHLYITVTDEAQLAKLASLARKIPCQLFSFLACV